MGKDAALNENRYLRWLSGETASVYWHDSAVVQELDEAISNSARGLTTNPFLIASTLKSDPGFWASVLPGVEPGIRGDARAEEWTVQVVAYLAAKVRGMRALGDACGYCCAQVNPSRPGDVETILAAAKRYQACGDNVVVKIAASRAGIEAIEECAALGMNVAATVSFTVAQVLAVGEAVRRGHERARKNGIRPGLGIAVLMVGRLDDYLRDVMQDTRAKATESDVVWAGTAAIKRAWRIFRERGYECRLMPAGCRGAYHVTQLAGADMVMSIAPGIAKALAGETELTPRINEDVDPGIIARLMGMPEFVKAYEPDGMQPEEFITFGSFNRTLDQFVQCGWNTLKEFGLQPG